MKESVFQFSNPSLVNLNFVINDNYSNDGNEAQMKLNMAVKVLKRDKPNEAIVRLEFRLGEENAECPFYIHAVQQADFRWGDKLEDEMLERLLNQNAASLLLSFLRPTITQITAASPYGAYYIPFIDFSGSDKTKKHS